MQKQQKKYMRMYKGVQLSAAKLSFYSNVSIDGDIHF